MTTPRTREALRAKLLARADSFEQEARDCLADMARADAENVAAGVATRFVNEPCADCQANGELMLLLREAAALLLSEARPPVTITLSADDQRQDERAPLA